MEQGDLLTRDVMRDGKWVFPVVRVKQPDGSWVVKPGEPVCRVRTQVAERMTGVPSKTLFRLAEAGLIRRAKVSEKVSFFWVGEIEDLIERCAADPGYARRVAYQADIEGLGG